MKTYYVNVTSPAYPQVTIQGILNRYEGGDGGNAGEVLGGDTGTVWRGTVHETLGINIVVDEKLPGARALTHVSGTVTEADIIAGQINTAVGLVAGQVRIPLVIKLELLKA